MTKAIEIKMSDFNLTEIVRSGLDTVVKLIAGGVIGSLITLLTRVSKKEHAALVKRMDDSNAAMTARIAELEKGHRDVATEADLRDVKAELKNDFQKALDTVNANFTTQMSGLYSQLDALRADLRLSKARQ